VTAAEQTEGAYRQYAIEEYHPHREPYYVPIGDEIELFDAAFKQKIPVLLKGPTGAGKTRFVEYMAWKLGRPLTIVRDAGEGKNGEATEALPLITVACHEDLTASDWSDATYWKATRRSGSTGR
jgi:nitric oxide reductase NorQ protein